MANDEHVESLRSGVPTWNAWRERNPAIRPDLRHADLDGLDLSDANLAHADLRQARLRRTRWTNARLWEAQLDGADFEDADLAEARELVEDQLAGTRLSRARLPARLGTFSRVAGLEKTFTGVHQLLLSLIVACIYSWLTIAGTTDAQLFSRSVAAPLPLIGTTIPLSWFYFVMPLLLFCLYVYFHVSLQALWETVAGLPAIFPDGKRRDQQCTPPLPDGLVRFVCEPFRGACPAGARVQAGVIALLLWGMVPATVFGSWWKYLAKDDWLVGFLAGLSVLSAGAGLMFYAQARQTLRGEVAAPTRVTIAVAGVTLLLAVVCALKTMQLCEETPWVQVPSAVRIVACRPAPQLDRADVSTRPPNWIGQTPFDDPELIKPELVRVKGASIPGVNLRHARGQEAFLVKANLEKATLRSGRFQQVDLRQANLRGAQLQHAHLAWADLRVADLREADLSDAMMYGALLDGAHLSIFNGCSLGCLNAASLKGTDLVTAYLRRADFKGADLSGADLTDAHLERAKLSAASLAAAHLEGANLSDADLSRQLVPSRPRCPDVCSVPTGADRVILYPQDASAPDHRITRLEGADLRRAHLRGAILANANLFGADLRDADGLTAEQVKAARNWDSAFHSDHLLAALGLPPDHNSILAERLAEEERRATSGSRGADRGRQSSAEPQARARLPWPVVTIASPCRPDRSTATP